MVKLKFFVIALVALSLITVSQIPKNKIESQALAAVIENKTDAPAANAEPQKTSEPTEISQPASATAAVPAPKLQTAPAPAPNPVATNTPTPAPAPAPTPTSCETGTFAAQFLCLINNYRASQGLGRLTYDSALNKVAYDYSVTMQQTGHFSHTGPDGSMFYERCAAQNTTCYAENLAKGFSSAKRLFEMWKASPGHNKNMVGPYRQIGLGVYGSYATTLFR